MNYGTVPIETRATGDSEKLHSAQAGMLPVFSGEETPPTVTLSRRWLPIWTARLAFRGARAVEQCLGSVEI
jgi:hypothetical protein